jgi:hypothetical protein
MELYLPYLRMYFEALNAIKRISGIFASHRDNPYEIMYFEWRA